MLINDKKSFVLHAVLDKLSYPIQDSLTLILLLYGFWNKILDVYLDQFESRYPRPSEFEKRTNLVSQVPDYLSYGFFHYYCYTG